VVFPAADVKLFVTASPEARARRRWLELRDRGVAADLAVVTREMAARDEQDSARAAAPLRAAADAVTIDTTALDRDAAFAAVLGAVAARLGVDVSDPASGSDRDEKRGRASNSRRR
jgi:CMP/dCMP kinase